MTYTQCTNYDGGKSNSQRTTDGCYYGGKREKRCLGELLSSASITCVTQVKEDKGAKYRCMIKELASTGKKDVPKAG